MATSRAPVRHRCQNDDNVSLFVVLLCWFCFFKPYLFVCIFFGLYLYLVVLFCLFCLWLCVLLICAFVRMSFSYMFCLFFFVYSCFLCFYLFNLVVFELCCMFFVVLLLCLWFLWGGL